jgi:hypothetical protein
MSNSPIEFMGDNPRQRTPDSEFGGADGLVQPAPHTMTVSEAHSAMIRAGDDGIDPMTGLAVPDDLNGTVA